MCKSRRWLFPGETYLDNGSNTDDRFFFYFFISKPQASLCIFDCCPLRNVCACAVCSRLQICINIRIKHGNVEYFEFSSPRRPTLRVEG